MGHLYHGYVSHNQVGYSFASAAPRVQIEVQQLQRGHDVATLGPRAAAQRASGAEGWTKFVAKIRQKSGKILENPQDLFKVDVPGFFQICQILKEGSTPWEE